MKARGIGAAIVDRLAREPASVAFTYASSGERAAELVRTIEAEGGKALAIHADSAYGKSDEIASFVAFPASEEAGYITGASLTIDGGFAA